MVTACAPVVWMRPGTPPAQTNTDLAQCQLFAEGVTPNVDPGNISTGNYRRDLAANAAASAMAGIAQGLAINRKAALCMQAKGYAPYAPGPELAAAPEVTSVPAANALPQPISAPP